MRRSYYGACITNDVNDGCNNDDGNISRNLCDFIGGIMYKIIEDGYLTTMVDKQAELINYQIEYLNGGEMGFCLPIEGVEDIDKFYVIRHIVGQKKGLVEYMYGTRPDYDRFRLGLIEFFRQLDKLESTLLAKNELILERGNIFIDCEESMVNVKLAYLPIRFDIAPFKQEAERATKEIIMQMILFCSQDGNSNQSDLYYDLNNRMMSKGYDFKSYCNIVKKMCDRKKIYKGCEEKKVENIKNMDFGVNKSGESVNKRKSLHSIVSKKSKDSKTYKIMREINGLKKSIWSSKVKRRKIVTLLGILMSILIMSIGCLMLLGIYNLIIHCLIIIAYVLIHILILLNRLDQYRQQQKRRTIENDSNTVYIKKGYI